MRILVFIVWGIRVPIALCAALFTSLNEALEDLQKDARSACPWPWLPDFEKRFEQSEHRGRERLLRGLRHEAN